MITIAKTNKTTYSNEEVNAKFLELLPLITRIARAAFRNYDADRRDDAVNDVIASAFINLKQLAEAGRLEEACGTPLAVFGVKRFRSGRRAGVPQSSTGVMAEHCRFLGRVKVHNVGLADHITDSFESEATAADARYPIHRTVQLRIDFFQTWLKNQSPKDQQIIRDLAYGECTNDVSRKYGISAGRVSQLRRKYADSWYEFISDKKEGPDFLEELKILAAQSEKESTN